MHDNAEEPQDDLRIAFLFADDYPTEEEHNTLQWAITHKQYPVVTSIVDDKNTPELIQSKNAAGISALDMLLEPQHSDVLDHVAQSITDPHMLRDTDDNPLYTLALKHNNESATTILCAADMQRPRGKRFLDQKNKHGVPELVTAYLCGPQLTQQTLGLWAMAYTNNDNIVSIANYMLGHGHHQQHDTPIPMPVTQQDVLSQLYTGTNPFTTAVMFSYLPEKERIDACNNIFRDPRTKAGLLTFIRNSSATHDAVLEDLIATFSAKPLHRNVIPYLIHNAYYDLPYISNDKDITHLARQLQTVSNHALRNKLQTLCLAYRPAPHGAFNSDMPFFHILSSCFNNTILMQDIDTIDTLLSYLYTQTSDSGSKAINYSILSPGIEKGLKALETNEGINIFITLGAYLARIPLNIRMEKIEQVLKNKLHAPLHTLFGRYYGQPDNMDRISQLMSQWMIIPGHNTNVYTYDENTKQRIGCINSQLCINPYNGELIIKNIPRGVRHKGIPEYNRFLRNIFETAPAITRQSNIQKYHANQVTHQ